MQFSLAVVAAAALTVVNAAQFTMPPQSFVGITAGKALNITWNQASGPVTILLKNGPANILKTVSTIASGQTGTSFIWTPATSLQDDTYALEIDDSGPPNYSVQFALTGGLASSSVVSGSTTASSAASSTGSSSSASVTSASNSTMTSSGKSSTGTASKTSGSSSSKTGSSTSTSSTSTSAPGNTNGAGSIASPLAFVFLALTAFITLN